MSSPAYHVYLGGVVDGADDLGRAWRRPLARAVRARGWHPVWPSPDLRQIDHVPVGEDETLARHIGKTRAMWDSLSPRRRVRGPISELLVCDAALFFQDGREGPGTAAEIALCVWAQIPFATCAPGSSAEALEEIARRLLA